MTAPGGDVVAVASLAEPGGGGLEPAASSAGREVGTVDLLDAGQTT